MTRMTALVMACCTAATAASAQVMRFDWDNGSRGGGESIRERFRSEQPPSPAGRDMSGYPRQGGGDTRSDWGPRRGGRMNGRPDSWDSRGVRQDAEKVERESAKLLADYVEKSRPDSGNFFKKLSRQAGINALTALNDAARRYRRELESRWSDPYETRENFHDLVKAMDQAEDAIAISHRGGEVRAQLQCVSEAVDDMVRYYRWEDGGGRGRDRDRDRGRYERPLCGGVNFYGKFYQGGGCSMDGCWTAGGGCNFYGCWEQGGGCNFYGCWRRGGGCEFHGCVGQVPKLPSQPCSD